MPRTNLISRLGQATGAGRQIAPEQDGCVRQDWHSLQADQHPRYRMVANDTWAAGFQTAILTAPPSTGMWAPLM